MRAPGLKALTLSILVLVALPAEATHPNFIDGVQVTDVNALTSAGLLYEEEQWQPGTITDSRGMYWTEWGGEYIGEYGSQAGWHYVANTYHGVQCQGSWRHRAVPTDETPAILDFDLGGVYALRSMVVWNYAEFSLTDPFWYSQGVRDVKVLYRAESSEEWQEYGRMVFAPMGFLGGDRPDGLYVTRGSGAWGTFRVSNALNVDHADLPTTVPIRSGPIFDHYDYPEDEPLTAGNLQPVSLEGLGPARYLRFEITSNWGHADEVGLMEVRFYKDGPGLYVDADPFPVYSWSYVHPGNHLDFGAGYRGWIKPREMRVYNLAPSEAIIEGVSAEGPFGALVETELPITLTPSEGVEYDYCTMHALFAPEILGAASGAIDIEYNWREGFVHRTLETEGFANDAAFGYIPFVTADANQWSDPWWGGYVPECAVNGERPEYLGGDLHMIENLGERVFGSKTALEQANNGDTWRTGGYPVFLGGPWWDDVVFAVDLATAMRTDALATSTLLTGSESRAAHDLQEIRIWNCTWLGDDPTSLTTCTTAMRHVRFEYSTDMEADDWEDVTDWRQWGPDAYELTQPEPNVDSPPTDILDVSDIGEPIRWWKMTTLSDPENSITPTWGNEDAVGLGQIRFYTSTSIVTVEPLEHDFGNLAPYETASSPEVALTNIADIDCTVESIAWAGNPGPFSITSGPQTPVVLPGGETMAPVVVEFHPTLYGEYEALLDIVVSDTGDPEKSPTATNRVLLPFTGACLRFENGFIPVAHAWASTSWDENWTPNWTHSLEGSNLHEEPADVLGSRNMRHSSQSASRAMWHARQPGYEDPGSVWLAWDLGESRPLRNMLVWNAARNCCEGSMRGFRRVAIQYTNDPPPAIATDSEWGPWGGDHTVPEDYAAAWNSLDWRHLTTATLAHYPAVSMEEPIDFSTPDGLYPASNQLDGSPIDFGGRTARVVRLVADSAPWVDWYLLGEEEGWYDIPNGYHFCLAEARFYGATPLADWDIAEHDFGPVEIGDAASFDVTVSNLADATSDLEIHGLLIEDRATTPRGPSPYSIAPATGGGTALPITLAPGESRAFTGTFAPDAPGDFDAFDAVILTSSTRDPMIMIPISGSAHTELPTRAMGDWVLYE